MYNLLQDIANFSGVSPAFQFPFLILLFLAIVFLITIPLIIIPLCLIFKKAGRSWWEALIPFYNLYILTVITGLPWWILLGYFVPILNWLVGIYMYYNLSKRFGFDIPFAIGLVLLPFIFLPILGYGSALYIPPAPKPAIEPVQPTPVV